MTLLDAITEASAEVKQRLDALENKCALHAAAIGNLHTVYKRLNALEKLATYAQNLSDRIDKLEMDTTAPATACDESVVSDGEPAVPNAVDLALLVREYRDKHGLNNLRGVRLVNAAERVLKQPGQTGPADQEVFGVGGAPQTEPVEPKVSVRLVRDYICAWERWNGTGFLSWSGGPSARQLHDAAKALFYSVNTAEREAHK